MAHSGARAKTEYQGAQPRALYAALQGIRREEEQDQRTGRTGAVPAASHTAWALGGGLNVLTPWHSLPACVGCELCPHGPVCMSLHDPVWICSQASLFACACTQMCTRLPWATLALSPLYPAPVWCLPNGRLCRYLCGAERDF